MSSYVVAFGGERLDRVAKVVLRSERAGTVEALLSANPGLAGQIIDGFVPAATAIKIPETVSFPTVSKTILAWE